jgi:hypothetical protein
MNMCIVTGSLIEALTITVALLVLEIAMYSFLLVRQYKVKRELI